MAAAAKSGRGVAGKGPRAYRFGKRIMFGVTDVRAWMDTMREPAGAATFPGATEAARG